MGDNGAGKSSLLDALAIAAGAFLQGLSVGTRSISKDIVRNKCCDVGTVADLEPQFPVSIAADGEVFGQSIRWRRELNRPNGRTTSAHAKQILAIASACLQGIRDGDPSVVLPILSYYGSGRRWVQKRERGSKSQFGPSRLDGYSGCMDDEPNARPILSWFEKMTVQEIQNNRTCPEFAAVKEAIARFYAAMTGASTVSLQFNLETHGIEIVARDSEGSASRCSMNDLSGGYGNTLSMVADIAYRMAVLNPQLQERVLEQTPGIVLIDVIELHLHPNVQQRILSDLQAIFPCVQFIVSTQSAPVIGAVRKEIFWCSRTPREPTLRVKKYMGVLQILRFAASWVPMSGFQL